MKSKKLIALVLSMGLLPLTLTGCGQTEADK